MAYNEALLRKEIMESLVRLIAYILKMSILTLVISIVAQKMYEYIQRLPKIRFVR